MFMHKSKKGFTIVELVIVIAVIAILAAVLIPTFSNLVKKANMSADQQAVRQMNTLLAAEEATGKPDTFANAINALLASKVSMKNYKALVSDMSFYWVKALNRVVYVDKNMTVTYPADLTETTYNMADGWFSLSGEVATDAKWEEKIDAATKTITIDNGATMVAFMEAVRTGDNAAKAVTTLNLTADIDLKGAEANFGIFSGTMTINGKKENGEAAKIYNFRNGVSSQYSDNNATNVLAAYGFGLFGEVKGTVTVKDVEFCGASVIAMPKTGKSYASGAGIIAGIVNGNATLTLENVTISDSYVHAGKKAGAVIGYARSETTFEVKGDKGLTVNNVQVSGGIQLAALVGYFQSEIKNGDSYLGASTINITAPVTATNVVVTRDTSYGDFGVTGQERTFETSNHYWWVVKSNASEAKNFN